MLRSNFTNEGMIKEYKNGNITIKFDLSADCRKRCSELEVVSWLLDSLDTYIIGEEFCLSNYDAGCMLYNCHTDHVYILSFTALNTAYNDGSILRLYARKPDADDLETIRAFYGEEA